MLYIINVNFGERKIVIVALKCFPQRWSLPFFLVGNWWMNIHIFIEKSLYFILKFYSWSSKIFLNKFHFCHLSMYFTSFAKIKRSLWSTIIIHGVTLVKVSTLPVCGKLFPNNLFHGNIVPSRVPTCFTVFIFSYLSLIFINFHYFSF